MARCGASRPLVALLAAGTLLTLLLTPAPPVAAETADHPVERILNFLKTTQRADGRWVPAAQWEAVVAVAALGEDPANVRRGPEAPSALDALAAGRAAYTKTIDWEGAILAIVAAGKDPHNFDGVDYVAKVRGGFAQGQFGDVTWVNDDMWAILSLRSAGVPVDDTQLQAAKTMVVANQNLDGGWPSNGGLKGGASGTDLTGIAVAALRAMDVPADDAAIQAGLAYLRTQQHESGAFLFSGKPNPQATAYALHGILAAGENPRSATWTKPGGNPLSYLWSRQAADGGIRLESGSAGNTWPTTQAVLPLLGIAFPITGFTSAKLDREAITVHVAVPAPLRPVLGNGQPVADAAWDFGDGTTGLGAAVNHAYAAEGRYPVRATAWDTSGRLGVAWGWVTVAPPPVAALNVSVASVHRGTEVRFDASGSHDPAGGALEYRFEFGDGTVREWSPVPTATHAYATPGLHLARLTVRATDGAEASATTEVRVVNRAPSLTLSGPATADRVVPISVAAAAVDPDGDPLRIEWFVDGAPVDSDALLTWTFQHLGDHQVAAVATDPFGATARSELRLRVANAFPTLRVVGTDPAIPLVNETVTVRAAAVDADGPEPRITWHLGDALLGEGATLLWQPREAKTYTLRVEAVDADGARAQATWSVVVRAQPAPQAAGTPEAAPGSEPPVEPKPVPVPEPATQAPPRVPPALVLTASALQVEAGNPVRFTAEAVSVNGSALTISPAPVFEQTFTTPGVHLVNATATDPWGLESQASLLIEVLPAAPREEPPATPLPNLPAAEAAPAPQNRSSPLPAAQTALVESPRDVPVPFVVAFVAVVVAALTRRR
ncbi:MAG TPA: PKD domain-containing protein [Candidatus Thermoplasmatota archaeon]|nr:PKD domain-containing protein [Candidatus Thermoplasmatota archaeon]